MANLLTLHMLDQWLEVRADNLDKQFMNSDMTQAEYDELNAELDVEYQRLAKRLPG